MNSEQITAFLPVSYTHLDVYKRQGDASDVGAALSKLQAHPMLRNALLFPQLLSLIHILFVC